MVIIKFHKAIEDINKKKEEMAEDGNPESAEWKKLENEYEMNKHQIITCLQITKYFFKLDSAIDVKPKIANLVFERAMDSDF